MSKARHPELDETALLSVERAAEYQRLTWILQWTQSSLKLGAVVAASSMARHQVQPAEGHVAAVVKAFGFLKKRPKRGAAIDSLDPAQIGECGILKPDFGNQH